MSRGSLLVKIGRCLQRVPPDWLKPLEAPFVRFGRGNIDEPNLIFLMALPRSGSTLTYQAMAHGFEPLYLSNLWNLLYAIPWTGGGLSLAFCPKHTSDFESEHGFVDGLCGPAEGLRFWSYWTGCGLDEVTSEKWPSSGKLEKRIEYFREISSRLASRERPMIAGYLGHVLAAEKIRAWFPDAIFVRLHRDPLSNADSILRSRLSGSGKWFSVRPVECATTRSQDVHFEVAAQVYWLNRRLAWLETDERTIHISYEGLCSDPNQTLDSILQKANSHGLSLTFKKPLPSAFAHRFVGAEQNADTKKLSCWLKRLEQEHGLLATPKVNQFGH